MRKIFKQLISLCLLLIALLSLSNHSDSIAADLPSYYNNIDTSTGEQLISSLSSLISTNTKNVGYSGLWDAYKTTDCKPGTNIIWDIYSNEEYECGGAKQGANYSSEGDSYNREHAVPQSWFNEQAPMKSDLFHVYPTDGYVNNKRANYLYGEVGSATYTSKNGSKLGKSNFEGYTGTVFEPIDEYKGDIARTYFYMATRYKDQLSSWTSGEAQKVFTGTYPYLTSYAINLFTKWNKEDPVSQKEINRNEAIFTLQNNRNPYIDNSKWIDYIWSSSSDDIIDDEEEKKDEALEQNYTFNLSSTNFSYTDSVTLNINGYNFKLSSAGCYDGEYRLGINKARSVSDVFNVSEACSSSLIMDFDIENAKSFTINSANTYSVAKFYIYFSNDSGLSWTLIKQTSSSNDLKATLENPETGRFALVIAGSNNPRLAISSIVIGIPDTKTPEIAEIQTNLSLGVNYTAIDDDIASASAKMIVSAHLNNILDGAKYYIMYNKSYLFNENVDENIISVANINNNEIKNVIELDYDTEYTFVILAYYNNNFYYSKKITYSIKDMINYYLKNNLIENQIYIKALEYIIK